MSPYSIFIERRERGLGAVGQRGHVVINEFEVAKRARGGGLGFGARGRDRSEAHETVATTEVDGLGSGHRSMDRLGINLLIVLVLFLSAKPEFRSDYEWEKGRRTIGRPNPFRGKELDLV